MAVSNNRPLGGLSVYESEEEEGMLKRKVILPNPHTVLMANLLCKRSTRRDYESLPNNF